MSRPHCCPICSGSGVYAPSGSCSTQLPTRQSDPCHGCHGTGIVWEVTFDAPPQPGYPVNPPRPGGGYKQH